jgi:hypothetical protein
METGRERDGNCETCESGNRWNRYSYMETNKRRTELRETKNDRNRREVETDERRRQMKDRYRWEIKTDKRSVQWDVDI